MKFNEKSEFPFVSIVICTYNRRKLLTDCLNSVFVMDYPESRYEIIVVDGGSSDGTKELYEEFPEIRFVTERRFGLAHARNKGAKLARGFIVAYTDDDCVVDKLWLRNLVAGFQFSKNIMGVGGPVYPLYPKIIQEKIHVKAALGLFDDGESTKLTEGIITSNSAFKKEIFRITKFDETLGTTRRGKLLLMGEDTDFCQAILASGHRLIYTPYAKVYHQTFIERLRVRYILKHAIHGGISHTRILLKKKNSRIWAIRYAVGGLVQSYFSIFKNRSFTSCYSLINSISTLLVCLTGLDTVL